MSHGSIVLEPSAVNQKDSPDTLSLSVSRPTSSQYCHHLFPEAMKSLVPSFTCADWKTGVP